ncbi:hypothetical protein ACRAQ6_04380 [Erythrobacter sp. HA6-11]
MTKPLQAMIWALAIVFVATLAGQGAIENGSATTLMIVLPLIASMQLSNRFSCKSNSRSC